MAADLHRGRILLLILLALTVLSNLPFLSTRLVVIHDTMQVFAIFHFVYSHLFYFSELPAWIPLICYGIPADISIGASHRECADLPGVSLLPYDGTEKCNYQYVVLEIDPAHAPLKRDDLLEVLYAENVRGRRYFYPGCHRMEPYRSYYPNAHLLLPVTESVANRVLLLPTGTSVDVDSIRAIVQLLRLALAGSGSVAQQLRQRPARYIP